MANLTHITRFGLPGIDPIPFGMHTCHFYSNRDQLVAALVPYFAAGLRANERCLWITAPPLPVQEAVAVLRDAWNGVDDAIQTGELRILDFDQWYASSAGLRGLDVVQIWLKEEKQALDEGCNGLRIAGNTSFLKRDDWSTFMEYEQAVTAHFKSRRIIALCSYALTQCTDQQMSEVLHAHHGALRSSDDDHWTMIYSEPGFEDDMKPSSTEQDALSECMNSETTFCEPGQALLDSDSSSRAWHDMERLGEELHTGEKRFRDMIDALPAAIYTTDAEGRLTHFNPAAVEFSGRMPKLGTDEWCVSWKLYYPDGTPMPHDECPMAVALKEGRIVRGVEAIAERPDGTRAWFTPYPTPLRDAEGKIVGGINMLVDITERKRTEEALQDLKLYLQQWNVELEQAVKIKTVELLQSQERLRALTTELNLTEQRERKRLAIELHDHLQQMLVLGKLKLGQGKRLTETVPAAAKLMQEADEVLSDALKYTRTLVTELSPPVLRDHGLPAGLKWLGEYMQKHDVTVTVTVPDEKMMLPEDQGTLLFQSVRELLINSSKHAGTGEATVVMEHRGGLLRIEVRDEGAGFDLAAVAAADEASSGGVSSKFGLFSIRERMRALGGSLEIESAPGQGTTAILLLPLRSSAECSVPSAEPTGIAAQIRTDHFALRTQHSGLQQNAKIRVLLVDDHIMVRQGLKAVLDAYADVELTGEAGNGEEAVRLVDQLRPAVVVMDITIPTMDGVEATKQIKRRYPETIVIGLSVNATKENEEAMKRAGAVGLLTKEAAVEQLYDVIVEAVKQKGTG